MGSIRLPLVLHRDSHCPAVTRIEVELACPAPGEFALRYLVTGHVGELAVPAPAAPVRRDGLWQHMCFEIFIAIPGQGYREFNFAPSGEWAAYGFSGYRIGMHDLDVAAPRIEARSTDGAFELQAAFSSEAFDSPVRLGLSAVIEEAGGQKSYWALAHPPGKADFHHPDCFAFELPALEHP